MKKQFLIILNMLILTLVSLGGCGEHECNIIGYYIGFTYEFEGCDVRVGIDENEERFIFDYTDKDPMTNLYFEFEFTYHTMTTLLNSSEFDYFDGGDEIVFDENGHYVSNGDKTIFISYKNANDEIKTAIVNKEFSVAFGFGTFKILEKMNIEG